MPAAVTAVIRSVVQAIVSAALSSAWGITLTTWLNDKAGLTFTEEQISTAAFGLVFAGVVFLTNYLGKRWPWVNQVISLGSSSSPAIYDRGGTPDIAVDTGGEDLGLDKGAVSVGVILALAAGVCAVAFFFTEGVVLLAVGILCLAVAYLAGGQQVG